MSIVTSRRGFREFVTRASETEQKKPKSARALTRANFSIYWGLLDGYRSAFLKIFLAACLTEVLYLAVPYAARSMIDGILLNTGLVLAAKKKLLLELGIALFIALIAAEIIDFWRRVYTVRLNGRFVRALRLRLFTHLVNLPLGKIHELKTGGIVSRLTSDAENLAGILQMALISPTIALLRITVTLVILFHWHFPMALIVSGILPPLVMISLIYILKVRPIYRSVSSDRSEQDARTSEIFVGIRAIKAYAMQLRERRRYNIAQALMFRKNIFASLRESAVDGIWNFLIPSTALAIMVIGGFFYLKGETSIGNLFAFQMYSGMLLYPVWRMVSSLSQIQKSLASLDRVVETLNEAPEQKLTGQAPPKQIETLEIKNLSFGYNPGQPVLKRISFKMKQSKIYAIIGESGIGKTTLIDLICRFYTPQTGTINANGTNIHEFDLIKWRASVALVTQDAILFDGSVRENLLTGTDPADVSRLKKVLVAADADDFIAELPQGLETLIGERGLKLSGGQKHRLTLARALMKNAPILVLDEATAHLDSLSEQRIRRQLDTIKNGHIVIIITHRLSTVSHADEIIVLSKSGGVSARGTHKSLLAKSSIYKKLWRAQ